MRPQELALRDKEPSEFRDDIMALSELYLAPFAADGVDITIDRTPESLDSMLLDDITGVSEWINTLPPDTAPRKEFIKDKMMGSVEVDLGHNGLLHDRVTFKAAQSSNPPYFHAGIYIPMQRLPFNGELSSKMSRAVVEFITEYILAANRHLIYGIEPLTDNARKKIRTTVVSVVMENDPFLPLSKAKPGFFVEVRADRQIVKCLINPHGIDPSKASGTYFVSHSVRKESKEGCDADKSAACIDLRPSDITLAMLYGDQDVDFVRRAKRLDIQQELSGLSVDELEYQVMEPVSSKVFAANHDIIYGLLRALPTLFIGAHGVNDCEAKKEYLAAATIIGDMSELYSELGTAVHDQRYPASTAMGQVTRMLDSLKGMEEAYKSYHALRSYTQEAAESAKNLNNKPLAPEISDSIGDIALSGVGSALSDIQRIRESLANHKEKFIDAYATLSSRARLMPIQLLGDDFPLPNQEIYSGKGSYRAPLSDKAAEKPVSSELL